MSANALVDYAFWNANVGNKDGQLPAKVQELLDKGADVHAVASSSSRLQEGMKVEADYRGKR